ncbi:Phage integrase family protein [Alkaliphilus peptidifermentans DSM 18978]|uniref:Phage integrase family protein n=1 Tax=Alkaliphilus peptidifermentans DSM 18978 TaxID=1120976 RepID=A0A1G5LEZ8_9FIRM|nr:Phage integrase family protein [Alkaliphilus peptidifermentans DSM 18978]
MDFRIKRVSGNLIVTFPYSMEVVKEIKGLGGGKWDPDLKYWKFKYSKDIYNRLEAIGKKFNNFSKTTNTYESIPIPFSEKTTEFINTLKLKGYSKNTIKSYKGHLLKFFQYIDYDLLKINSLWVKKYTLHLLDSNGLSHSYVNQAINSIKFYFQYITEDIESIDKIIRPKVEKKLPQILSEIEVKKIFDVTTNPKHKLLLMLTYSAGLRVSEVINLKLTDIDSDRMLLKVCQGKGRKDRYTLLS